MLLELRTVLFMGAISSVLMAIVLFGASRVYPRSVKGLTHWGWGALGFGVSGMFFAARDLVPVWLSVIVANTIFAGSYVLWWRGMRLLLGQALRPLRQWYMVLTAVLLFLVYFTLVQPELGPRLVLISGISCLFYASMAVLVWRSGQHMRGNYFFIGLMLFGGGATLLRVVATSLNPSSTSSLLTPSIPQTIYLVAYSLLALLDGIGFFLLASSKLQVELQQMADHDPLTGAMNRRALMDKLGIEVAVARRKSHPIALIVMDLDHFKKINDTLGHDGGDAVLRHFAALVQGNKRPQDLFARMGGEEFVLLLPDTDLVGAQLVARRLHGVLNQPRADKVPAYTCSFGVGVWRGAPSSSTDSQFPQESIDAWFKRVDDAVYRAKDAGRNCIETVAEAADFADPVPQ